MTPDFLWVGMVGLVLIAVIIAAMTANNRGGTSPNGKQNADDMATKPRSKTARHGGLKS